MTKLCTCPQWLILSVIVVAVLLSGGSHAYSAAQCDSTSRNLTPLNELIGSYQGHAGGLYPGGTNSPPADHDSAGQALAHAYVPLDKLGEIDTINGIWVLLSIGMSNTNLEFGSFAAALQGDTTIHPQLRLINGAQGGWAAEEIKYDTSGYWAIPDNRLRWAGLHPVQVQAVWLKNVHQGPSGTFPAEAMSLRDDLREIVRLLKVRFPNLSQVFLSSRIYAGYASSGGSPEPYAYESGFANRWLIESQIAGNDSLNFDSTTGAVNAPWLAWGPYLYADGTTPRQSDGLQWLCSDYNQTDGTHPGPTGIAKVATLLDEFFRHSPYTTPWFLRSVASSCACACHADPACDGIRSDVLDVVATINVAFRGVPAVVSGVCPNEDTDVNCSGATDILDVIAVVNVAFRGDSAAIEFCDPCT